MSNKFRRLLGAIYTRFWRLPRTDRIYKQLSLAETFSNIYSQKIWGDNGQPFFSGGGSHGTASDQYCAAVAQFIRDNNIQHVVELGCGDFAIGRRIVDATGIRYIGIDIVPALIDHHKATIHDPRIQFFCADATTDPLPSADLYLVRQVLQHLSNAEIARALANLGPTARVLVSEDVPLHPRWHNVDKNHGPGIRDGGSGVYVDRAPFSLPATELWSFPLYDDNILRTVLIEPSSPATP